MAASCRWSKRWARSTLILINLFMDGLHLSGAPAATPWHYDAVEERSSTSSKLPVGAKAAIHRKPSVDVIGSNRPIPDESNAGEKSSLLAPVDLGQTAPVVGRLKFFSRGSIGRRACRLVLFFWRDSDPAHVGAAGKATAHPTGSRKRRGAYDATVPGGAELTAIWRTANDPAADNPTVPADGECCRRKRQRASQDCKKDKFPPHWIGS
jgi:hypothetical protein